MLSIFRFPRLVLDRLAAMNRDIRMQTATTLALAEAVTALSQSVTNAVATIQAELSKIDVANDANDTAAVTAATTTIRSLAATLDQATTDAANALNPQPGQDPAPVDQPQT